MADASHHAPTIYHSPVAHAAIAAAQEKSSSIDMEAMADRLMRTGFAPAVALTLAPILANEAVGHFGRKMHGAMVQTPLAKRKHIKKILQHANLSKMPAISYPHLNNAFYADPEHWGDPEYAERDLPVIEKYFNRHKGSLDRARQYGLVAYDPSFGTQGILAHEAGHATLRNQPTSSLSRFNQSYLYPLGQWVNQAAPYVGTLAGWATGNPLIGAGLGGGYGLLTGAPVLTSEAQATGHAKRYARENIDPEEQKLTNTALNNAFGTYASSLLLPGLLAGGAAGALAYDPESWQRMAHGAKNFGHMIAQRVSSPFNKGAANLADRNSARQIGIYNKEADLKPEIVLQPHQQRVADRVAGPDPRMLVYHGLGTGKSLAAIAAAEAAKKNSGGEYAIVAPASLRDNFKKEVSKFTTGSTPDVLSYTGLGMGQQPNNNPETLIFDEAHRLRNPEGLASQAAAEAARKAKRLVLLTGSPITNEPSDLANLMGMLRNEQITPESFEQQFVNYKKVKPGWGGWLRGVKPGEEAEVKNPEQLKAMLRGHVDFNPGKSPEGVNINQQVLDAPMTAEQERIQKAIRTKIPPRFLWKLDQEFPLSRDELGKLNSFLTGMRQISLSTQPFRADKNPLKAYEQSGKLQLAMQKLQETLNSDPRKKALIYSNYIDAGLGPYAAALAKNKIPHAVFHGGVPLAERRKALDEYNAGKLKALLIGPAGAEGISTKGTSLIQLLDPHWNETRSQQAQGRGLRFDSHMDLPEELKNVAVQRFISKAKEPGWLKKHLMGAQRVRTGDEILDRLAKEKEVVNDKFRTILKQVGSESLQEEQARKMYDDHGPDEHTQTPRKAAGVSLQG